MKLSEIIAGLETESTNIIISSSSESGEVSEDTQYRLEVLSQAIKGLQQLNKMSQIILKSELVNGSKLKD